jgi:hypothetical protein
MNVFYIRSTGVLSLSILNQVVLVHGQPCNPFRFVHNVHSAKIKTGGKKRGKDEAMKIN